MYLEATPACLPLNMTNTNFIAVHLQVCDMLSLKCGTEGMAWMKCSSCSPSK